MSPQIFLTGATGYIGGDVLHELVTWHPDWQVVFLVRDVEKGREIEARYPSTKHLLGDLNATGTIEQAASEADIVFHLANCDHAESTSAIVRGLGKRQQQRPGFLIHCSGTLSLSTETIDRACFGELTTHVYDDWSGLQELTSLPDHAEHRDVDKIVLEASKKYPGAIKTAIVSPPLIYGQGRGVHNQRSKQIYRLAESFMKHERAFMIGSGQNMWHHIHVQDLSRLFVKLGEAATGNAGDNSELWNENGYYLVEHGAFAWRDIVQTLANMLNERGLLARNEIERLSAGEANELMPYAKYMIGTNARGRALRAPRLLAWRPVEQTLVEELPIIIEGEARRLGLVSRSRE